MNPYAIGPLCETCNDIRTVTVSVRARAVDLRPCPRCGADPHPDGPESKESRDRYDNFVRARMAEQRRSVDIVESDLTPEEFKLYNQWRDEHPHVSKVTVLSWIEGRRYDPSMDAEFVADVEKKLAEWRSERDRADAEYREGHPYSAGDPRAKGASRSAPLLEDREARRGAWRRILEEPTPRPLRAAHPCIKCGAACDEQTLFCPPCWQRWRETHPDRP